MKLLQNKDIYYEVIENGILKAKKFIWIATANLKDMHIKKGLRYVPILDSFADMALDGISIRLIHAGEPSREFQKTFDKHKELIRGDVEFMQCPRVHFKTVIVDGKMAFSGSANFTGAGLGVKSERNRNFEVGFLFDDAETVKKLMNIFDEVWMGNNCNKCGRRTLCPDPIE